ncbi:MAG: hypothetical protein L0Z70_06905 [Chloroflexi bacterium]|nr:hypothetical protein [Chloroflexota bacterium]
MDSFNQEIRPSLAAIRRRGDWASLNAWLRGRLNWLYAAGPAEEHLEAAMAWLCAAQDGAGDDGVSAFYDVRMGMWQPSYPETSGYILPTFYDYAALTGRQEFRQRAELIAQWLLTLQLDSGAFPIGPLWPDWKREPIVFDTGQIMHGLARAYEETKEDAYLQSARRAGAWLREIQDEDGAWRRHTSLGYVHTYNVRTAWALLRVDQIYPDAALRETGMHNLDWALSQQDADGWYRNAEFRPEEAPLTHTIAYTIEGLLESGVLSGDARYIASARRAADALLKLQARDGFLRGRYGPGWGSQEDWSCLTGDAQVALVWLRLYELTGEPAYYDAGLQANHYVKQRQARKSPSLGFNGGVSGSYPIHAQYEPFRQLNWAAKFFADSLLLEIRLRR